MIEATNETVEEPVWARAEAFPPAPEKWGWLSAKGCRFPCDSLEILAAAVRDDRNASVLLAWTPEHPQMRLPEEIDALGAAIAVARDRWTREDVEATSVRLRWFSLIFAAMTGYTFFTAMSSAVRQAASSGVTLGWLSRIESASMAALRSTHLGIALLLFVVFGFIPWYQARKRRTELGKWGSGDSAALVPALRFETWLGLQRAPVTYILLGLMALVAVAQIMPGDSVQAAGLVKKNYLGGEWWRLFTAPFLHGNIVHFLMNMGALIYLGKRLEVFARWPHLTLVFLFAAVVGGEASTRFTDATSVGASGGLMGWLGFLIVFETLHGRLVPRSARRRLVAGVLLTAVIGLLGYRFIDNAAHLGGLLAGMAYALIVFPKSTSPKRPSSPLTDRLVGGAALGVLVAMAGFAVWRIAGG